MIIVWGIAILALALFFISSIMKGQNVLKTNRFLSSLSDDDLYNTFTFEIKDLEDLSIKLISAGHKTPALPPIRPAKRCTGKKYRP